MLGTKFFMSFCCTPMRQFKARIAYWMLVIVFGLLCSLSPASADNRDEIIFFFNDALGSAVAAVDESGDLCWSELYTPYGDKTVNDDLVNRTGCGIVGEERGFTGHTEDVNSDLVYMQQRYYDPSIGRFLSIDPLDADPEDPKTYNRYAYANNNPYKYVDPDGEAAVLAVIAAIGIGLTVHETYENLQSNGPAAAVKSALVGAGLTVATGGAAKVGLSLGARIGRFLGRNDVTNSGKHFSGKGKPWTSGATPNSTYTHIDPKTGKAKQNAIYDANGNVDGHVDFKNHGKGAPSGHGHKFPDPGNPASGHGPGKPHIPNDQLPSDWDKLPSGVQPHTPIGN